MTPTERATRLRDAISACCAEGMTDYAIVARYHLPLLLVRTITIPQRAAIAAARAERESQAPRRAAEREAERLRAATHPYILQVARRK